MRSLRSTVKEKFRQHILIPLTESHAPIGEAALGSAVGMFMGMTPTVGVQMWMVLSTWLVFKYVLRVRFDLMIGTAMVWLSNPVTMGPLYYGFLVTGAWFFKLIGTGEVMLSYTDFSERLAAIDGSATLSLQEKFMEGVHFLIFELGYPMVIGSLFWATPLAILSYYFTYKYLRLYRMKKAANLGLSYEAWREKFEKKS
ncbi:MAG: hypothetical protein A2600_02920 [Candidatus Lambdaproteobacteria bacterium RIFOXYD1_FULL_56_27]|uniref:DUF2062 domain-containing protein n=1 Tax=Candidatus Lambdaproteobacteria bacterium RIFOXYD2_FULL_56_26 TaxID=1817773 RepID=A0A1F6H2Y7_9PROT|nr:MAG: hypothetical protein A2557_06985 [Candidatus Lambdaproteobacteria bacterium RIFOXYD2_FULL_56_26]OGH05348.1 MAG: hypothetical protein A2426_05310 [Candidatus Lambdaproteobacteria bacterium RIFOXYC1_FULL_56_13]OGH09190.1 MAG: hypothetical protein A2600_02920 [Candidatus Lambdaproteobacteria bacterium RIFOXYD1_FULL_56_27]